MTITQRVQALITDKAGDQAPELLKRLGNPDEETLIRALGFTAGVDVPRRMLAAAGFTGNTLHLLLEHERRDENITDRDNTLAAKLQEATASLRHRADWDLVDTLTDSWELEACVMDQFSTETGFDSAGSDVHRTIGRLMGRIPEDASFLSFFSWPDTLEDLVSRTVGRPEAEDVLIEEFRDGKWVSAEEPSQPGASSGGELSDEDFDQIEGVAGKDFADTLRKMAAGGTKVVGIGPGSTETIRF